MKKKHKLRPLDALYGHPHLPLNPKVKSQHTDKFMKKFSREEDSHVKGTHKITAAPSVSNSLLERVAFESKIQIIGLPNVYLGDTAVLQDSVNDHTQLDSSEMSNIPRASVCPISCFEVVPNLDSLKAPAAFEDQQPLQNVNTFQTTVGYQDQNVLDYQYDDSSCISKENGENMTRNDCIQDIGHKNVMPSVKFAGSSAASEASSSRNKPTAAKGLASVCTKEPAECDVSMKAEAGCSDANPSVTDSLKGCDENHVKYKSPLRNMQKIRKPSVQGQTVGVNDGTDELVDVRVCDICGDVGREAMLALCSKCSDGAEHIYCMRIKMDSVPDGDWICEECVGMQEPKRRKLAQADKSNHPSNLHLEEGSGDLVKNESRVKYADALKTKPSAKSSCLSSKRPGSDIDVGQVPKRRTLEGSVPSVKSSSGGSGKTSLSRISSLKNMNKGTYDTHGVSSLSGQNTKKMTVDACSSPGHGSLEVGSNREVKAASKNVNLEKSVQPLNNTVSRGNLQLTRVSSMKIGGKGNQAARQGYTLGQKSAKEVVAERLHSPRPHQQICRGMLSKSRSINIPDSNKEVRRQSKDIHPDGSAKESSNSSLNKKCPEKKLLRSVSFSGVASASHNVSNSRFSPTKPDLRHGNGINSTGKCDSAVGRSPRFGPYFSAADGTKVSTHRTKVGSNSPHLLKNNGQEMKVIRENGKSNLSKEESGRSIKPCGPVAYQGKNCTNASVARPIGDTIPTSRSSSGITSPTKNVSPYPDQKANQSSRKPEIECLLRVDKGHLVASNKAPTIDLYSMEEMGAVINSEMFAVPEPEFIWKGIFKLEEGCKLPRVCNVQAHLSTCASSKVADLAQKFHQSLLLKEVSRLDTWPIQFQRNLPTEEDIGVYFFAEDLESYSRSYKMVLEGMIANDLALEADFDGVQLLVFSSSLLPLRSQRWNTFPFLWGVFRVRKVDNFVVHNPSLNIPSFNQASTRSTDQSFKHEVAQLEKCVSSPGSENVLCEANSVPLADNLLEKERLPGSVLSDDDNKKHDEYANEELKSFSEPCAVPPKQPDVELGQNVVYLAVDPDAGYKAPCQTREEEKMTFVASGSSFSVDSGPSGSSDGVGCAKLDEGQVEQSQDLKKFDFDLNVDLSLETELERVDIDLNLDLVLGVPQTELCPKDTSKDSDNNLLVFSLGMPC